MDKSSKDDRRFDRATVIFVATIEHDDNSIPVKVSNVSARGALLVGKGFPPEGARVVFRRNDLAVESRISWADRNLAGIEFCEVRPIAELLRHVPKLRETVRPYFRRPGLRTDRNTTNEN